MHLFYIPLYRELVGYYLRAKAENEEILQLYLNKYYGRIWNGIYTKKPMGVAVGNIIVIHKNTAKALLEDAEKLKYPIEGEDESENQETK